MSIGFVGRSVWPSEVNNDMEWERKPRITVTSATICFWVFLSFSFVNGDNGPSAAPALAPSTAKRLNTTAVAASGFVRRNGSNLVVDGKVFKFAGANFYPAMITAAGNPPNDSTRPAVEKLLDAMGPLGLTVLRCWAFNDGPAWQSLQFSPGNYSEHVMSEGLDWLIQQAGARGIRLLLTFTTYPTAYGGMEQYVKWSSTNNISMFYTDSTIKGWYKNFVKELVTRVNTKTGVPYARDPAIFGWELANEPLNPGDDSGNVITDWITEMSAYVKSLDPNHLVTVGSHGYYGRSTPARLKENPFTYNVYGADMNNGAPYPYNAVCEGADFKRNFAPATVDVAMIHLWPDHWIAGSLEYQIEWSRQWILGHAQEAALLGKPLIIGEFGKIRPLVDRNKFIASVYSEAAKHSNIAGTMLWFLSADPSIPGYVGFDAFAVFPNAESYVAPKAFDYKPPSQWGNLSAHSMELFNWRGYMECFDRNNPPSSVGWNDTVALIRANAVAVSGNPASL